MSLFKRFLDELDDLSRRYLLHALELSLEKWDPSPLYHFLSFIERESALRSIDYKVKELSFKSYPGAKIVVLPKPGEWISSLKPPVSASDNEVSSLQNLSSLSMEILSELLFRSLFVISNHNMRNLKLPYVSFVGQPIIEVYLYTKIVGDLHNKISHYLPHTHILEILREDDLSKELYIATMDHSFEKSSVVVIFTIRYKDVFINNNQRAYRLALLEAGSVLSRFIETAFDLNLRIKLSLNFFDRHICRNLELDCYNEFPVALVAII